MRKKYGMARKDMLRPSPVDNPPSLLSKDVKYRKKVLQHSLFAK
jgi:hypothetical protein